MRALRTDHPRRGFTLIELLIVISIIGLLAAVLLPQLFETGQAAKVTATRSTMLMLESGINTYQRNGPGTYPPDDFKPVGDKEKAAWKADNGRNTGVESLVCFLSQSRQTGTDLTSLADHFVNTDGDDNGVEMPLLKRKDRIEVADHFGTPLVYFAKYGMDKPQQVVMPEGDVITVKAKRRPDGHFYGEGKCQLLSAGPDRIFGNDDDIVWPEN